MMLSIIIRCQQRSNPLVILLLISLIFLCSCAATTPVSQNNSEQSRMVLDSTYNSILILKPLVRFERLKDESRLPDSSYGGDAFGTKLVIDAITEVDSHHFIPVDTRSSSNGKLVSIYNSLQSMSPEITSGFINNKAKGILIQLDSLMEHPLVLVQYFKVKIGTGGSWDPYSGAITSSNSSTSFFASLISCKTGEVFWKNQVLLRDSPQINNLNFKESIDLLYKTFPMRKE